MKTINLKDRRSYFASDELIEQLTKHPNYEENGIILNFAFTDYGGDFFDKIVIEHFEKEHPENIASENTYYFGKNAFIFGDVAKDFLEESENYILGFENIEDYYFNRQNEEEEQGFKRFIEDNKKYNSIKFKKNTLDFLMETRSGYYSITTQGVDFCESELLNYCYENNLIIKK